MAWQAVDWRDAFRVRMVEGITEKSSFQLVREIQFEESDQIQPGRTGIWVLRGRSVWFLDPSGGFTEVWKSPRYVSGLSTNLKGDVLLEEGKASSGVRYYNLDLGKYVPKEILPPWIKELLKKGYYVGYLSLVKQFCSSVEPRYLYSRRISDVMTSVSSVLYELYTESGELVSRETNPRMEHPENAMYYYRGRLYRCWDFVDDFEWCHTTNSRKSCYVLGFRDRYLITNSGLENHISLINLETKKRVYLYFRNKPEIVTNPPEYWNGAEWVEAVISVGNVLLFLIRYRDGIYKLFSVR